MNRYYTSDIKLNNLGDFELDSNGDLVTVTGEDLIQQMATICLKTTNPDWFNDAIAADLEDLIGKPNSRDTAELGKSKIKNALISTGFFEAKDIWVEAKVYDEATIIFFLFINSPFSAAPIVYQITLDLGSGTLIRRVS
jgi:hypothetical protein